MTLASHGAGSPPKIRVKLTGPSSLHLTRTAWNLSEKLWKAYGIDLEIEDDPYYLVNHLVGVGLGGGGVQVVVEDSSGSLQVYELDAEDAGAEERLESLVLNVLTRGVPILDRDSNESLTQRDAYVDLAMA